MKTKKLIISGLALVTFVASAAPFTLPGQVPAVVELNSDWSFALGNAAEPELDFGCGTEYFSYLSKAASIHNTGPYSFSFEEDSRWQKVNLPHDWASFQPFDSLASYSHGFKTVGFKYPESSIGWYRKTIIIPEEYRGKHLRLRFGGIYRNARIWVNGFYLGGKESGYISQEYDISDYLLYGADNLICVRCDASLEEGWYYEGAGIYRPVSIAVSEPLHFASKGIKLSYTLDPDFAKAHVKVESEVCNDANGSSTDYITEYIINTPSGMELARFRSQGRAIEARKSRILSTGFALSGLEFWSPSSPKLYEIRCNLYDSQGRLCDSQTHKLGIRSIEMDPDRGLLLNNEPFKIKGVNLHLDHAGVGTAVPKGLLRYRLERLKWMGVNTIRSSHNPVDDAFLELCDEMGFLLYEETRLMGINPYHIELVEDMILTGRNHACVFLWGIGNEEWGIEWNERGERISRTMARYVHKLDPERKVAVASSSGPNVLLGSDVAGYNYIRQHPIDDNHKQYPQRIALGSEETTGCGTRGVYYPCPAGSGRKMSRNFDPADSLGFAASEGWEFYNDREWLMGFCYWTGFDYRGEPTPMQFPATGSFFGLLDYCGFPKDEAWYVKSRFSSEPSVYLFPHWNLYGMEGQTVRMRAFSNCDEVLLSLNGKEISREQVGRNGLVEWDLPFESGKLQAKAYRDGVLVAEYSLESSGAPAKVLADVHSYEGGIKVVNLTVLDSAGRFVPDACVDIKVKLPERTEFLGWGNGDSAFTLDEKNLAELRSFNGYAQLILFSDREDFNFTSKNCSL